MCMKEVESRPKGTDSICSLKKAEDSRAKPNIFLRHCTILYEVNNWL